MNDTATKNQRARRANRIKAAKAARNVPTAILLKKKAECDAEALKIVERLLEPNVGVEWLLQSLGQINRTHMQDIIEERAIVKLCGYVLCNNRLTKIVNKKYQISTLRNKVYDIEKVKNFCSYSCYVAMDHIMIQMLTSPLWLRNEEEIPKFTILSRCKRRTNSPPGVEVNIMGIELSEDDNNDVLVPPGDRKKVGTQLKQDTINRTHSYERQAQNEKASQAPLNAEKIQINKDVDCTTLHSQLPEDILLPKPSINILESGADCKLSQPESLSSNPVPIQMKSEQTSPPSINIVKPIENPRKNISAKKIRDKTKPTTVSLETLTTRIEQSFTEWITQDTISLLYGEQTDKQQIIDNVTRQDKYMTLCRKLNHIQLQEETEECSSTIPLDDLKPAPDYSVLKEEAKDLEIKVRAFYEAKTNVNMPDSNEMKSDHVEETENIIPFTDAHNPRGLRRRIFLDKLNKVLPDLLHALIGPEHMQCAYSTDKVITVKTLINTFELSATNIVFRTAEWTLIGLIIIKMLGIIDPPIKSLLLTKKATMYMSMILMAYKLDSMYLDYLINSRTMPMKLNYSDLEDKSD